MTAGRRIVNYASRRFGFKKSEISFPIIPGILGGLRNSDYEIQRVRYYVGEDVVPIGDVHKFLLDFSGKLIRLNGSTYGSHEIYSKGSEENHYFDLIHFENGTTKKATLEVLVKRKEVN